MSLQWFLNEPLYKMKSIICHNITKSYALGDSEVKALRGVNLEVNQGELLMLVGPSGCGKTTLISVIASILDPSAGEIVVLGKNIRQMSDAEKIAFRARNIGFVFQSFNLLSSLNAAENVAVPLIINGVKKDFALEHAKIILNQVGLGSKYNALPSQLSGGQQQRVAIARSLVHNPRLIVCDEPTSALDHETGSKVMELMRHLALADGRTLIIVTHDNRIFEYADRIAYMDDGIITNIEKLG